MEWLRPADGVIMLWHPDSPGMRVPVPNRWWNRRRDFATLGQVGRYYKHMDRRQA